MWSCFALPLILLVVVEVIVGGGDVFPFRDAQGLWDTSLKNDQMLPLRPGLVYRLENDVDPTASSPTVISNKTLFSVGYNPAHQTFTYTKNNQLVEVRLLVNHTDPITKINFRLVVIREGVSIYVSGPCMQVEHLVDYSRKEDLKNLDQIEIVVDAEQPGEFFRTGKEGFFKIPYQQRIHARGAKLLGKSIRLWLSLSQRSAWGINFSDMNNELILQIMSAVLRYNMSDPTSEEYDAIMRADDNLTSTIPWNEAKAEGASSFDLTIAFNQYGMEITHSTWIFTPHGNLTNTTFYHPEKEDWWGIEMGVWGEKLTIHSIEMMNGVGEV